MAGYLVGAGGPAAAGGVCPGPGQPLAAASAARFAADAYAAGVGKNNLPLWKRITEWAARSVNLLLNYIEIILKKD